MQLPIIDASGKSEKVRVSDVLFADKLSPQVLAQVIRVYQANSRQGTSYTKTRSEVRRTKKKWYRQKGTGNARHGARTPNLFVGGGVSHGPRANENWSLKAPQALKLLALKQALTLQRKQLFLSKELTSLKAKTKQAQSLLSSIAKPEEKLLIVFNNPSPLARRSLSNLANVSMTSADRLNALQVLNADKLVIDFATLKTLEKRLMKVKKHSKK